MRGGFRPNAGRPRTRARYPADLVRKAGALKIDPLEYMLGVMRDPKADPVRRDRMAIAAAPFLHPRIADNRIGKKDAERDAAATAGQDTEWGDDLKPPPDAWQ